MIIHSIGKLIVSLAFEILSSSTALRCFYSKIYKCVYIISFFSINRRDVRIDRFWDNFLFSENESN